MKWSDVIEDSTLQNLPYKVELNEWGNIVLSPASNKHGLLQAEIAGLLRDRRGEGKVLTECSVSTFKGVKVADVSWGSKTFFENNGLNTPYEQAPELCVEIISPSNRKQEIEEKVNLYLAKGAQEVWICDEDGVIEFYGYRGRIEKSVLFADVPKKILC